MLLRSAELIGWAIGGLEREITQTRERLASLTAQAAKLRARAGAKRGRPAADAGGAEVAPAGSAKAGRKRRRRKMSPETRARLSEMMKKRWAEKKKSR
jgi:hypothetical protein